MAGGCPDSQGEEELPGNWPCGGDVEGSGGNFNCHLTASITYHNFLHGFREGRGTGTANLEAKLLHQIAALREEVLYLHTAYDALDRSRCLEILEGYGVSPRSWVLLKIYWRRLTMVVRAGRD